MLVYVPPHQFGEDYMTAAEWDTAGAGSQDYCWTVVAALEYAADSYRLAPQPTHWMPLPAPPHENARARADEAGQGT